VRRGPCLVGTRLAAALPGFGPAWVRPCLGGRSCPGPARWRR